MLYMSEVKRTVINLVVVNKLIDEQGRTRRWIADKCGIQTPHLSLILNGERFPSRPVMKLLAHALGVSETAILVDEGSEEAS
jgi:transcriptional regulator with XRE-family HTH domain